jgi:flagellar biosynthetic protein FliR
MVSFNLVDYASAQTYGYMLVLCRVSFAIMLLPGFGERVVPPRTKVLLSAAIAMVIHPMVSGLPQDMPDQWVIAVSQVGSECVSGALLGTCGRIFFSALAVAGTLMGQAMSLSQLQGSPVGFDLETPMGAVLFLFGMMMIFILDLHEGMIRSILGSYDIIPAATWIDPWDLMNSVTTTVGQAFSLGVQLALPFILMAFLVNVAFAAINRAMVAMPVFFVAMPIGVGLGLYIAATAVPSAIREFVERFSEFVAKGGFN